ITIHASFRSPPWVSTLLVPLWFTRQGLSTAHGATHTPPDLDALELSWTESRKSHADDEGASGMLRPAEQRSPHYIAASPGDLGLPPRAIAHAIQAMVKPDSTSTM